MTLLQAGDTVRAPNIDRALTVVATDVRRIYCAGDAQPIHFLPSLRLFAGDQPLQFMEWALRVLTSNSGAALFTTGHGQSNSGTGAIDAGAIVNGDKWIPALYTITFTSSAAWNVKNSGGVQVAAGAYADPSTIAFLGIQVTISGAPASGDTFTLTPVQGAVQ